MTRKELKKRLWVVKKSIRNASGINRIELELEFETIIFLLMRG